MPEYRLYYLDGARHIHLAEWIVAGSDTEAAAIARQMTPDARIRELWLKSRLVARMENGDQR